MEKLLEIILSIIYSIVSALNSSYILYVLSTIINKTKYKYKNLLIGILAVLPFCILNNYIMLNMQRIKLIMPFIAIIICGLITFLLYKVKFSKTLIVSMIYMFLTFIIDIIFAVYLSLVGSSPEIINQNKNYYYILATIANLTAIFLIYITYKLITRRDRLSVFKENYKYILYQALTIVLCLMPSMYMMFSNLYDYSLMFLIINAFQLIIVSAFSIIYLKKGIYFKDTELELENTKLHNQALSTINENIRGFKHDMGNMVQAINGYLAVGNIDGVKAYCQNLLHGFNDINLLSILSPKIINDPAIYGIVVSKMLYARENNLTLSLDIGLDVSQINFPSFELSRIIGILLDNAIEASLESDEKKLKLEMYHDDNRNQDVIIIGNSVKDSSKIDIIKMFEKNYSTKENPSGFGLYEVLKFFKKNNKGDIVPNLDYDTEFFTQTVTFDR